jgi:hypothetical protein
MKDASESKNKSKHEGQLDPFNEPRTIPGQWDVSAFQSLPKSSASDPASSDDVNMGSFPDESSTSRKESEPSGIKYLDPDFDEDSQRANRKWRTY